MATSVQTQGDSMAVRVNHIDARSTACQGTAVDIGADTKSAVQALKCCVARRCLFDAFSNDTASSRSCWAAMTLETVETLNSSY